MASLRALLHGALERRPCLGGGILRRPRVGNVRSIAARIRRSSGEAFCRCALPGCRTDALVPLYRQLESAGPATVRVDLSPASARRQLGLRLAEAMAGRGLAGYAGIGRGRARLADLGFWPGH